MKLKYRLLVICAAVGLLSVPFAFIGCSENRSTETEVEYGDWITVTSPSCENDGVEVRTSLDDPRITETRAIPATGHDWNEWETISEPTCLLTGVKTRTCNTCDNSDIRAIPALGHDWDEWETVLDADCENCGTEVRVCLRDGKHTEYRDIPALGHDFGDWVLTLAPTCTVGGVETRYCRNNNRHTELHAIEPYGHNWCPNITTKRATCTEPGEQKSVCVNDSTHVHTSTVKALGHDFGDWVMSVPATESEDGVDIRVCRHDSTHTETRVAPALGSVDFLRFIPNSDGTEYAVTTDPNHKPSGTVYIPAEYNGLPVTAIASSAFNRCDIEDIVILGNNLQTVRIGAFTGCQKLQSIELPEGVTFIAALAINNCKNLKSISLPSTVAEIGLLPGRDTYYGFIRTCPSLETITVAEGNTAYKVDNGCLIETATSALLGGTRNAVIPKYTMKILPFAFYGSGVESICIPARVTSIGQNAFSHCNELREVVFEKGKYTGLEIQPGIYLGEVFANCENLESVVLPDTVTNISQSMFKNCTSLREIELNKNMKTVGSTVFEGWTAEQTIVVKGFASQEEADAAWGSNWRGKCNAIIVYEG